MTQEEPSREVTGSPGAPVNAWWKLVPFAPTELMRVAGARAVSESFMQGKDVAKMAIDAYEAMLASAPVAEALGSNEQGNMASQEPPVAGLAALGLWALQQTRGTYIGSDISGADIQDKAEELGLLVRVEVTEQCGEECLCAEWDDFPQQCLRYSKAMSAAPQQEQTP